MSVLWCECSPTAFVVFRSVLEDHHEEVRERAEYDDEDAQEAQHITADRADHEQEARVPLVGF